MPCVAGAFYPGTAREIREQIEAYLGEIVIQVSGTIRAMEAEMKPVASSVRRIEDYLLNSNLQALTRK